MFRFEYDPGTIRYGDCTALDEELSTLDVEDALVVTGQTVGSTPAVMDPVREGIDDRFAGLFDETTPEKRLETVFAGARRLEASGADGLLAVGGGSSIDTAKLISVVAGSDRSSEELYDIFEERGTIPVPDGELTPIAAVPTTLAGADLSMIAGITSRRDGLVRGGVFDPRLMPSLLWYDPDLFRTTPAGVLTASAMNGFDKALETPYAEAATPITDATASRALTLLGENLPAVGDGDRGEALEQTIVGTVLAQYGCSRSDGLTLSLIHAFGHGIARGFEIQQGGAHGIIAPHALRYLFEETDGRRDLIGPALGVAAESEAIVDRVTEIRDGLGLPGRLREIPDLSRSDLPAIAEDVASDSFIGNCAGLEPTAAELEAVLEAAY